MKTQRNVLPAGVSCAAFASDVSAWTHRCISLHGNYMACCVLRKGLRDNFPFKFFISWENPD